MHVLVAVVFVVVFLEQYLHTQCSWGLKIHYKPSTLTEVYCEPFFSTVVQVKVSPCKYVIFWPFSEATNDLDHNSPKFCSAGL